MLQKRLLKRLVCSGNPSWLGGWEGLCSPLVLDGKMVSTAKDGHLLSGTTFIGYSNFEIKIMPNSTGFLTDPKVVISLMALVVSLFTLIWNLANQWEQNRRWEAINAPNIVLREAKMLPWEKITASQAKTTNWGYVPEIFAGELKDEFLLLSTLKLRMLKDDQPLDAVASTVLEAETEVKRLGLASQVQLAKTLRPFFQFENIGKTTAYKTNISVDIVDAISPKKEWRRAFEANSQPDVGAGQLTSAYFDVGLPGVGTIGTLLFRVNTEFEDGKGLKRSSFTEFSWDAKANYWHHTASK